MQFNALIYQIFLPRNNLLLYVLVYNAFLLQVFPQAQ